MTGTAVCVHSPTREDNSGSTAYRRASGDGTLAGSLWWCYLFLTEYRGVCCDAGFLLVPGLRLTLWALIRVINGEWNKRVCAFPAFAPRISQLDGPSWPLLSGCPLPMRVPPCEANMPAVLMQ